jgi:hypothetical protein
MTILSIKFINTIFFMLILGICQSQIGDSITWHTQDTLKSQKILVIDKKYSKLYFQDSICFQVVKLIGKDSQTGILHQDSIKRIEYVRICMNEKYYLIKYSYEH